MARPGRISTSPASAWDRRRAKSTSPGARAGACACSTGWSPITTNSGRIEERAMLWRPGVAFILLAIAGAPAPAAAKPALTGCDAFIARLRLTASDMQVEFSHSLVVSRAKTDVDVFDITTNADVDATLRCHGDEFIRLEVRITEPASARASTSFDRFAEASLRARRRAPLEDFRSFRGGEPARRHELGRRPQPDHAARHGGRRSRISGRFQAARRRLHLRQDGRTG